MQTFVSRVAFLALFLSIFTGTHAFSAGMEFAGKYRAHLFFGDTQPFVDEVTLNFSVTGKVTGQMHVPNDFDADIQDARFDGQQLRFNVLVPKNASRPVDLLFHYRLDAFDGDLTKSVGFASLLQSDGQPITPATYIGSVVMFRIEQ